ncbi:nucleotidyltransferase domain-containing protein [Candidatus Woesearchaeota archaeon]|nr:nucleotidyltransferase domain-containing protein [Candidatus Woesearchaeota archaeon]
MLHNKYSEILNQFLGDYSKRIYGRELIGKVPLSQKGIALDLEQLEKKGILKSEREGNIRFYRLNLMNPGIKDIVISAEISKKIEFFERRRKIAHIFRKDDRIIGIFGSYAKGIEKETSDIDVFIIGSKEKNDYNDQGKIYDLNISIIYFSEREFKKLIKEKNELCKEIIKDHIIIFSMEKFVNIIWGDYYGFD